MKIQILVAHPDDEVIMCGATIDKLIKKGHSVFISFYTQNGEAYFEKESQIMRRKRAKREAQTSSKYLGHKINFLGFQDMHIEKDKGLLLKSTIAEIRRVQPDLIITHCEKDKHIDHRTLGKIVPEANFQSGCRLCGGNQTWSAKAIIQGEIDLEMTTSFNYQIVSTFSKINMKNKIKAFSFYESINEEHATEAKWLVNKILYLARLRGQSVGANYGEAFIINNFSPLNFKALSTITCLLKI